MTTPLTAELARFVALLKPADLPAGALPFIRIAFTDIFATLVAGRGSDEVKILLEALQPAPGESRLLVDRGTARPSDAAFVNATAAHALDFDDAAQRGHISVVVVPALLAEAEALSASGERIATAYGAGYEVWAELIRREPDHYHNHSWHPTGVFGPLAAAAACASLRGLTPEQTAHALAIASSQSSGMIANFGTMTKPFHAGRASQAGLMAARLAQLGYKASDDALEHPKGLMRGISPHGRVDLDSAVEVGRVWKLPRAGVNIKKYPLCFAAHRALDGMLEIVESHSPEPQDVEHIQISISRRNRSTLRFSRPQTALEAKFSMQFAMAAAIIAGACGLPQLRDDFVMRSDVQDLMGRVEVLPDDREDATRPGEAPRDVVRLQMRDGRIHMREVDYVRGGPEVALAPGELFGKFKGCLEAGGLGAPPRPLYEALMTIDALPAVARLYALADA